MPGNKCSNCVAFNSECTHDLSQSKEKRESRRKRHNNDPAAEKTSAGEPAPVEQTIKNIVDGLLCQTPPYQVPKDHEALLKLLLEVARYARSLERELDACRDRTSPSSSDQAHTLPSEQRGSSSVSPKAEEQDEEDVTGVVIDLQKLPAHLRRITTDTSNNRFFGTNSSVLFVQAAIEAARENDSSDSIPRLTRPEYWAPQPWETYPEASVIQSFPPDDLLWDLVDIYFTQINIFWFVLHRPTFEKSIRDGLHLRDHRFGATVLAVCAVASRNSPDKRVLLLGTRYETSAGWEWFRQIPRPFSSPLVGTASLYELQLCCLYLMYQQMGSDVESCWLLSGIGILHAQDIGAHRGPNQDHPFALRELTNRCVHYLSIYDAICSACYGRPRVACRFNLTLPTLCDDEYWEHPDPEKAFKQPAGTPCRVAYLAAYINLIEIFSLSWRDKGQYADYTGKKYLDADTVAELDSRLNKWAEEIPEHLLWNPYMEDDVFFEQSVALYASFYHVQILVHRPSIPTRRRPSSTIFKPLAICANAARSSSHVVDVKLRRGAFISYHTLKSAFDSAVALVLNISGGARSGLSIGTDRELVDVYKCMALVRQAERRWQNAGRCYDMLCELLAGSKLPLPPVEPPSTQWIDNPRGVKHASGIPDFEGRTEDPESYPEDLFYLPMVVEDLGRLPIYGSIESSEMDILDRITPIDILDGSADPLSSGMDFPVSSTEMNLNPYLQCWEPYYSGVDELTQILQTTPSEDLPDRKSVV